MRSSLFSCLQSAPTSKGPQGGNAIRDRIRRSPLRRIGLIKNCICNYVDTLVFKTRHRGRRAAKQHEAPWIFFWIFFYLDIFLSVTDDYVCGYTILNAGWGHVSVVSITDHYNNTVLFRWRIGWRGVFDRPCMNGIPGAWKMRSFFIYCTSTIRFLFSCQLSIPM